MKGRVFCYMMYAMLGIIFPDNGSATPVFPYRTMEVPFADPAPELDGIVDYVYGYEQSTDWIYPEQQPGYGGPLDFTAIFHLCWDLDYLYIISIITDDIEHNYWWSYSSPWMFDNIEVFLQLDTNTSYTGYDNLTEQIRICRGLDSVEACGQVGRSEYGYYMDSSYPNGWVTELAIPWRFAATGGILPEDILSYVEDGMGFDFMGSDSDLASGDPVVGERDYMTAWDLDGQNGMEDQAWQNVMVFGCITFEMNGNPPPPPSPIHYIEPVRTIDIPEVVVPMTIDGYDYETSWGSKQTLELFNSFNWEAEYDLSGYFKTCWDRDYLYLYAHINDHENQSWPGNNSYGSLYDNLEVFLDLDTLATDTRYRSNSTALLRFCRGNDLVESTGRADASEFQYTMWNFGNGTGWALEAAIPWTAALAADASPEDIEEHLPVIGFDIIVNDMDEESLIPREEHSQLVFDRDEYYSSGPFMENEALTNTRTFGIAVLQNALPVHTPDGRTEIKLYPNPVSSWLFLSGLDEVDMIEILDISGQQIIHTGNTSSNRSVDVSRLTSGLYFICFYSKDRPILTSKFFVE